jgi:hypothetical protein
LANTLQFLGQLGYNRIFLDPATVSYINLFINGILQPGNQYMVETGKLTFTSGDAPKQEVLLFFNL